MEYKRLPLCYWCPSANWDFVEPVSCDITDAPLEKQLEIQRVYAKTLKGIECPLLKK